MSNNPSSETDAAGQRTSQVAMDHPPSTFVAGIAGAGSPIGNYAQPAAPQQSQAAINQFSADTFAFASAGISGAGWSTDHATPPEAPQQHTARVAIDYASDTIMFDFAGAGNPRAASWSSERIILPDAAEKQMPPIEQLPLDVFDPDGVGHVGASWPTDREHTDWVF
jgi:hypothetical protein